MLWRKSSQNNTNSIKRSYQKILQQPVRIFLYNVVFFVFYVMYVLIQLGLVRK